MSLDSVVPIIKIKRQLKCLHKDFIDLLVVLFYNVIVNNNNNYYFY